MRAKNEDTKIRIYEYINDYLATASMTTANANYTLKSDSTTKNFTITNATIGDSGAFSNYSGIYDKTAHGIGYDETKIAVVNGQTVTLEFSTDNAVWGTAPTYTDFTNGAKTVYWKLSAPNHNDLTGNNTVTITQKEVGLTWRTFSAADLVYSKTAKEITATATELCNEDACTVTVALSSGKNDANVGSFTYKATGFPTTTTSYPKM